MSMKKKATKKKGAGIVGTFAAFLAGFTKKPDPFGTIPRGFGVPGETVVPPDEWAAAELERRRRINAEGARGRAAWRRFVDVMLGRDPGPNIDVPDDWLESNRRGRR